MVGLHADELCDAGAYPATGSVEPGKTRLMAGGPYRVPVIEFTARSVMTNLAPTGAYRGPGRAEATALLERTMDLLAAELGIDPVEVRRRNLISSDEYPYATATGLHYDSGDYARLLDTALERGDYDGWRARQQERRARRDGRLLGIGVSVVVDSTAWFSRRQAATVEITGDGVVEVRSVTASAGQQHEIALRAIVDGVLPVGVERIDVIEGDTGRAPASDGSMGSRSTQLAGTAARLAAEQVLAKARRVAASVLEAAEEDLVFLDGAFSVRGVPARGVGLAELAIHARELDEGADDGEVGLVATCVFDQPDAAYPSAAHLSVVEVDPETGRVTPIRHVAVTDCGCVVDPPGAEGQVVGASVQGIAAGAVRAGRPRRRRHAARDQPGRVPGAVGRRGPRRRDALGGHAQPPQPARRQGRRRDRDDRRPRRGPRRGPRRARPVRRPPPRRPLHPRVRLARGCAASDRIRPA